MNNFSYESLIKNTHGFVLVDFMAEWCAPCKTISKILDEIDNQFSDIKVLKVDIEKDTSFAENHTVRSIPTLILFKNGEVVDRLVGNQSKLNILKMIESCR